MAKRKPKILLWDIERSHSVVGTFGMYNTTIHYGSVLKHSSIICGAWKFLGEKKIYTSSITDNKSIFKKDRGDDYYVVSALKQAIESADVIVAHYGDKFDLKFFNTRCLYHGIAPVAKPITIDTYKVAKKHFLFDFNKLDYLGQYLSVGSKLKTDNSMWLAVINPKVDHHSAIKKVEEMVKYNKQDVILLEKVYLKLHPFMDNHPNANLFIESKVPVCPNCSSVHLHSRGYRRTRSSIFKRYNCQDCGAWSSGESVKTSGVK